LKKGGDTTVLSKRKKKSYFGGLAVFSRKNREGGERKTLENICEKEPSTRRWWTDLG